MKYINFLIRDSKSKIVGVFLFISTMAQSIIEVFGLFVTYKLIEDDIEILSYLNLTVLNGKVLGLLLISVLFISGCLKLVITYYTTLYSQRIRKDLTRHFLYSIKNDNLSSFTTYGRANYQKDLFQELDNLTANFIQPIFLVISPIILCVVYGSFGLVVLGESFIYLLLSLVALYCIYFTSIMGSLKRFGVEHVVINTIRNKELLYVLNNIRNYKLGNIYLNQLEPYLFRLGVINSKVFLSMQAPKVVLDFIVFASIIILVLFSTTDNNQLFQDLLFVFLVASRLIPPAQAMYNTASAIRVGFPSLVHLYEKYDKLGSSCGIANISHINDLSFKVNDNLVNFKDLDISRHGVYHIDGASGSGKSTLIDVLTGLRNPAHFVGTRTNYSTMILTSDTYVPEQTALELFGISQVNFNARQSELYSILQLNDVISTPFERFHISSSADNISNGQRQRLVIFSAFLKDLDVLIIDEATSGFSGHIESNLLEFFSKQNLIVFFVTHRKIDFNFIEVIRL